MAGGVQGGESIGEGKDLGVVAGDETIEAPTGCRI